MVMLNAMMQDRNMPKIVLGDGGETRHHLCGLKVQDTNSPERCSGLLVRCPLRGAMMLKAVSQSMTMKGTSSKQSLYSLPLQGDNRWSPFISSPSCRQ